MAGSDEPALHSDDEGAAPRLPPWLLAARAGGNFGSLDAPRFAPAPRGPPQAALPSEALLQLLRGAGQDAQGDPPADELAVDWDAEEAEEERQLQAALAASLAEHETHAAPRSSDDSDSSEPDEETGWAAEAAEEEDPELQRLAALRASARDAAAFSEAQQLAELLAAAGLVGPSFAGEEEEEEEEPVAALPSRAEAARRMLALVQDMQRQAAEAAAEAAAVARAANARESAARRYVHQEQDAAYAASLAADRARAEAAEQAAAAAAAQEAAAAASAAAMRDALQKAAAFALSEEPPAGEPGALDLLLEVPCAGLRLRRRFPATAAPAAVYDVVRRAVALAALEAGGAEAAVRLCAPGGLRLRAAVPPFAVLTDAVGATLGGVGVAARDKLVGDAGDS